MMLRKINHTHVSCIIIFKIFFKLLMYDCMHVTLLLLMQLIKRISCKTIVKIGIRTIEMKQL